MGALLTILPSILQVAQGVAPLLQGADDADEGWFTKNMPLILTTVGNGAQLLSQWHALASQPDGPTDEQLADLAAQMESALTASQAALRG